MALQKLLTFQYTFIIFYLNSTGSLVAFSPSFKSPLPLLICNASLWSKTFQLLSWSKIYVFCLMPVFLTISQTEKSHGKQTKQTTFFQKTEQKQTTFSENFPKNRPISMSKSETNEIKLSEGWTPRKWTFSCKNSDRLPYFYKFDAPQAKLLEHGIWDFFNDRWKRYKNTFFQVDY